MPDSNSATPLDVEACVQLLTEDAEDYEQQARNLHTTLKTIKYTPAQAKRVRVEIAAREAKAATWRALASALPGMGKALDLVRDCPRCQGYLRSGRLTLAQSEREAQSVLDRLSAARAAQPEEPRDG